MFHAEFTWRSSGTAALLHRSFPLAVTGVHLDKLGRYTIIEVSGPPLLRISALLKWVTSRQYQFFLPYWLRSLVWPSEGKGVGKGTAGREICKQKDRLVT